MIKFSNFRKIDKSIKLPYLLDGDLIASRGDYRNLVALGRGDLGRYETCEY